VALVILIDLKIHVGTLTSWSRESSTKKVEFSFLQTQESGIILLLRTLTRRTTNKLIRSDLDSQSGVYGKSTIFGRTVSKKAAGR
jgi:hypothetical protein